MRQTGAFAAVLVAAAGCGPDHGQWDSVAIEDAWLERFDLSALTVGVGTLQGDALLVFTEPGGNTGAVPVHLGGGTLGIALDLSADPEGHEGVVDIDLTDVKDPTVGDVFGTYHGTGSSGAALVGGSRRRMKNGAGASFREDHFALGISLYAGYQWVTIREGGNDGEEHDDLFDWNDDPTDTDLPTTPTDSGSDTAPPAVEPTSGGSSSGCNADGDHGGGDDDGEGTGDDDDDGGGGSSPPPSSGGGSAGGGGGGGGSGGGGGGGACSGGSASGCACSTGSGAPLGFTAALLFLRFRRAGSGASRRSSRGRSAVR